jgi:hypothetical protein
VESSSGASERLFWWQVVGLCGTVSAVGLIVTG